MVSHTMMVILILTNDADELQIPARQIMQLDTLSIVLMTLILLFESYKNDFLWIHHF